MNKKLFDALRAKKHMTLEHLSEKTHIPVSTLTKISAGYVDTSFHNMCRIAKALDCSLDDLTDNAPSSITNNDRELLRKYHQLTDHNKNAIQMLLEMHLPVKTETTVSTHQISCIHPTLCQGDGFASDCYTTTFITVADNTIYATADFAFHVSSYYLAPTFCMHDIVYLQYQFPETGHIGLFQYDNKLFFGRFCPQYDCSGGIYLKPIQFDNCPAKRYDSQKLQCLGAVITAQHAGMQSCQ